MSRRDRFAQHVLAMPGAVYSPFADRLRDHPGPVYPLHVGDTWKEPPPSARMEAQRVADHEGLHRYCDTRGVPALVDAVVDKLAKKNGIAASRESVLITAGATAGLGCAVGALIEPADEVLILAPFWPLIRGIVQAFGGTPVEVPFYDRVDSAAAAVAAVAAACTDRTVALYVSTPSNPTGRVLSGEWLAALAGWAEAEDVWLIADEVYEDFVYHGRHASLAPLAPDRTVTAFSFSKGYGMAGNRVGYLAGPDALIDEARKLGTHTFYNAPTASQHAALAALRDGDAWQGETRDAYREVGAQAAEMLGVGPPEGSTFLFLDVSDRLDDRGLHGVLEDCFEQGVLVAPGLSSGRDYADWVRLCFTVLPPERTLEAVGLIAPIAGR